MQLLPTDEQYAAVQTRYPVPQLRLIEKSALVQLHASTLKPFAELTIEEWWIHLSNRMIHARNAYHLMRYFLELGIPDDRPWISPGRNGVSVEYFPDFTDDDYSTKAWFDFYCDAFSQKRFSAWDSIGQLLAEAHGITVMRPTFHSVANAMKDRGVEIGEMLLALLNRDGFKRFRDLRHDTTHNFLPGTFGGTVIRDQNPEPIVMSDGRRVFPRASYSFGVGNYVRSRDRVELADTALIIFADTLQICGLRK